MTTIICEIGCEAPTVDEFRRIADAVHDAPGVGFIKWQAFIVSDLVSERRDPAQHKKLKALEWTYAQHAEAKAHVDALPGVKPLVSVFSPSAVQMAADLGFRDLKIGSGELTDEKTVKAAADRISDTRGTLFVSTGMANPREIRQAAEWVNPLRAVWFACTSAYPCVEQAAHVRRIEWLREHIAPNYESGYSRVGYSDHTEYSLAGQLAVALGANWIEKHVTGGKGPDADMALDVASFRAWCEDIRLVEDTLGQRRPHLLKCELDTFNKARKRPSWTGGRIEFGDALEGHEVRMLRPWKGKGEL